MKKISDFKVGDRAEIIHLITNDDISNFVRLTGDDNKLHVDEKFAASTSYGKPVAHGMLGASFLSTVIGTKLPGDGALWYSQKIEFLLPIRVGDQITVVAEIVRISESNNSIELSTEIFNQYKQKVTSGIANVKLVEQKQDAVQNSIEINQRKNAIVIGATGGIGRAICLKLAKQAFNLIIHYNTSKLKAEEISKECSLFGINCYIIKANITNEKEVESLKDFVIRKFSIVNVVINTSTIKIPALKFEILDWQTFLDHIDINVKSTFLLAKLFVPIMINNKGGKFIGITTQFTENAPPIELSPYVTAKYALNGIYKSLAVEYASKGIIFNLVSPGMTETELISDVPEKIRLLNSAKTPLKRLASPVDIANAVAFLAGSDSDFITGETIRVNGGQVML